MSDNVISIVERIAERRTIQMPTRVRARRDIALPKRVVYEQ